MTYDIPRPHRHKKPACMEEMQAGFVWRGFLLAVKLDLPLLFNRHRLRRLHMLHQ